MRDYMDRRVTPPKRVNRSLNYPLMVFDVQTGDCVVNYVDLFWKSAVHSSVNCPWVQKLIITILSASLAYEKRVTSFELRKKDLALDRSSKLRRLVVLSWKKDKKPERNSGSNAGIRTHDVIAVQFLYWKIPKISPGAYISQRPFLRGLFLEGLISGGKFAYQNRLD